MKRRTIFFLTLSLVIILALVQATLVSADGSTTEGDCFNPETGEPCTTGDDGGNDEGGYTSPEEPPSLCEFGNPGNAKCVGKAGEKTPFDFYHPVFDEFGTHGRSDWFKHDPHPSVQDQLPDPPE
jgi:hypothetical protein